MGVNLLMNRRRMALNNNRMYYGGIPVYINNVYYNNTNDKTDGDTKQNTEYFVAGPFDTGSTGQKTYTIKTVTAPGTVQAFLRVFNDLTANSTDCFGLSREDATRTLSIWGRYLFVTVEKAKANEFFIHDDTNNRYICKGRSVT